MTEQSTLVCKQWRFLCESQFCLASRNSTGIKLERPMRSLGLVLGGMNPEVSVSDSHHRTGTTAISQCSSSSRTQRSWQSLTSYITDIFTDRSALRDEVGKTYMIVVPTPECQPSAMLLTESAWPCLMMEPVCIIHSIITAALNVQMKWTAFLFIAPNFDVH